jgi:hypothetical protein
MSRNRRVKCDEGFPACNRCVSTNRVCPGYGVWGGGGAVHSEHPHTSAPTSSSGHSPLSEVLCTGPRVSTEEQIYLEWFLRGTATHTPRIFNSPFWDPVILEATKQEPMVLQALLALSAAHKRKILDPANRARDDLVPDAQEVFLLKQHGLAIKNLQNFLKNGAETTRQRLLLAVIMCNLLVLMEYGRGRYDVGYLHLNSGALLVKKLIQGFCKSVCDLKLAQFFPRLQDQMEVYRARKHARNSGLSAPSLGVTPILRFKSVEEAGLHLEDLVDLLAHATKEARLLPPTATAAWRLLQNDWEYLMACFEAWLLAYDATLADLGLSVEGREVEAWTALRQRYVMAMRMADVGAREMGTQHVSPADVWLKSQKSVLVML